MKQYPFRMGCYEWEKKLKMPYCEMSLKIDRENLEIVVYFANL